MGAMSAPGSGKPTLRIRGTTYPVLLPSIRDPRLHLAAVIISLQVLGQVAFDFRLSIAQILVSLLTCAVLEVGIAFRRQHVILWPASALLTGNGVAFILRVPGTEHGDWWSMHGWWVFAGTAAVSLLSKHLIQFRGGHIFNPSNFGLVLCFLLLGPELADPLEFWWGPMSFWLALALAIIVGGGFAILRRLRLLHIAVTFWVTFAVSIAVLAASGHDMTARWHLGPVSDWHFWRVLAFSPEILVFLFFMITDPKTIPAGKTGRRVYAVAIGLLAALLIAPQTTEFGSKVALLAALAIVCAARPVLELDRRGSARARLVGPHRRRGGARGRGRVRRPARRRRDPRPLERGGDVSSPRRPVPLPGRERPRRRRGSRRSTAGRRSGSRSTSSPTSRTRPRRSAAATARVRRRVRTAPASRPCGGRSTRRGTPDVPRYTVERVRVTLEPGDGQSPPLVVATRDGDGRSAAARRVRFAETVRARAEGRALPDHRRARISGPADRPLRRPRRRAAAWTSPPRSGSTSRTRPSGSGSRTRRRR